MKMEELAKRISAYQLLNFLLTGSIFWIVLSYSINIQQFLPDNIVVAIALYYFTGMVISRVGSLVVEPLFKLIKVVRFAPYSKYVKAVKKDPKIDVLVQENNIYRTFVSLFILYGVTLGIYNAWGDVISQHKYLALTVLTVLILALFIVSYIKQSDYIKKRVEASDGKN